MSVVGVLEPNYQVARAYFEAQGWMSAETPQPGRFSLMVRNRLDVATLTTCLAAPWVGGMEMEGTGLKPVGACFRRHLAEGGLGLSLRSDTARDDRIAPVFAAAVRKRLRLTGGDAPDLDFVLHEMISNAVLHGNFAVPPAPDLVMDELEWFGLRVEAALTDPELAGRRVQISAARVEDRLEIAVEDDGAGYDPSTLTNDPVRPHGLTLVAELASSLRIEENGRRAVAAFSLHPEPRDLPEVDLSDAKVLVVEDNAVNSRLLRDLLTSIGVGRIELVDSGEAGLAAIERQRPDLVMLDVMMPGMGGFEMCRRLRRIHPLTDLPVIFVTALSGQADRATCFAAGGNDVVTKPFDIFEFTSRVTVHLRLSLMVEKLRSYQERVHEELRAARNAQLSLTPTSAQLAAQRRRTGLVVEGVVETSSELGGDFWTVFDAGPHQTGLLVADFAGHGPVAAFNVFRLHLLLSRLPRQMPSPKELLERLNLELKALLKPGEFAAAFAALIDVEKGTLSYAGGASPSPILLCGGQARFLDASGPPLGAFADAEYEETVIDMPPGATLLAYSDALIESEVGGALVCDEKRLLEWVTAAPENDVLPEVLARFRQRLPGEPPDDLTLVSIRRPG